MSAGQPRSSGSSRLTSDRLASTVTADAVGGRAGQVGDRDLEQVGVAVVHDPVLRPGQPRREPAAHRPGAAAEIVDHAAAGCRKVRLESVDEVE